MTPAAVTAAALWSVAVLWIIPSDDDPPNRTLFSNETFRSEDDCVKALPRFTESAHKRYVNPGPVVCVRAKE